MSNSRNTSHYYSSGKSRRSTPVSAEMGQPGMFSSGQGLSPQRTDTFPELDLLYDAAPGPYSSSYSQPRSMAFDHTPHYDQWGLSSSQHAPHVNYPYYGYEANTRYATPPPFMSHRPEDRGTYQGHDTRKLPPLHTSSAPPREAWYTSTMPGSVPQDRCDYIRSPTAAYPDPYYYSSLSNVNSSYYTPYDQRHTPVTTTSGTSHTPSPPRRPPSAHRSRSPPPISPSSTEEPMVRKKRKRADAQQLKVLNEVYARTAFPSTDERQALARKLDMSARSVQIWFQNKRQSMKQTNRQSGALNANVQGSSSRLSHNPHPYGPIASGSSLVQRSSVPSSHRRVHDDDPDPNYYSRRH